MRIYEGGPRQDYEEALRSIGSFLDQRGMRDVLLLETSDGFVIQGLVPQLTDGGWSEATGTLHKETYTFLDDDVARFMEEAYAQRKRGRTVAGAGSDSFYERALRVLGRYIDEQKPRDVFLFELEHSFVVRLLMAARNGDRHVLAEFTRDEVEQMIAAGRELRNGSAEVGAAS